MDIDTTNYSASKTSLLFQINNASARAAGTNSYDAVEIKETTKFDTKPDEQVKDQANNAEGKNAKKDKKDALIKKAIDSTNKVIIPSKRMLEYSIHEETHQIMVKVIDTNTDEVIREIPPEKVLDSYAKMLELAGLIIDTQS